MGEKLEYSIWQKEKNQITSWKDTIHTYVHKFTYIFNLNNEI